MSVDVYINFNGNCREAVEFYAKIFGNSDPQIMTFGEAPPNPDYPLPEAAKALVMHARLDVDGSNVMFSDVFPGMPFTAGNNISLALVTRNEEDVKSWFHQLKEGGSVTMELQETFWSKCYGSLKDKFGIEWQVSLESNETAGK
ncbi:VOC family protein [Paenibacillus sp. FSL R7-0331]|uniref:VOC family protein n=1 Tax=Paenibacillus sp. FSL R7-0331 TaxID=1536773 RepID=UPI0004F7FBDE|nr:VOC family protein [Paenibacillus sp. FSL R7-0331]AIQ53530.1 glyoxalase [Paenibacillus sp. FSL R7-0331]